MTGRIMVLLLGFTHPSLLGPVDAASGALAAAPDEGSAPVDALAVMRNARPFEFRVETLGRGGWGVDEIATALAVSHLSYVAAAAEATAHARPDERITVRRRGI